MPLCTAPHSAPPLLRFVTGSIAGDVGSHLSPIVAAVAAGADDGREELEQYEQQQHLMHYLMQAAVSVYRPSATDCGFPGPFFTG